MREAVFGERHRSQSRKIVGFQMVERMTKKLVIQAQGRKCNQQQPEEGLLHHSDRGSQYAPHDYQARLATFKQTQKRIFEYITCFYNAKRIHSRLGRAAYFSRFFYSLYLSIDRGSIRIFICLSYIL
ncbi:IS3 family transposase [Gorillibacterium timonense]|uniref:IS3 family transposase n=1 Tax=Gorillibacterium timonense TaxID=1689269 RepID=UPI000D52743B